MNEQKTLLIAKYAQAVLNSFKKPFSYDDAQHCLALAHTLKKDTKILFFLPLNIINLQTKKEVIKKLVAKHNAPQELENLFLLMLKHRRTTLIPQVLYYLYQHYLKVNNIEPMTISSSHKLNDDELKTIVQKLEQQTQKKILPTTHIETNLIAGVRAQSNETLWEQSIAQQLRVLEQTMNHEG